MTLLIVTCLWDANENSKYFSQYYDETWVDKLCRGFRRNLTAPHEFVVFTDKPRKFSETVRQEPLEYDHPSYADFVRPYRLNEPMILVGLDTVVVGNIDHLAHYCMSGGKIALPRPFPDGQSNNGVALVPAGHRRVYDEWRGENDMEWTRRQDHAVIDELFPTSVVSYKLQGVRQNGIRDARIVYFHGTPKPHQMPDVPWVQEHWK